MFFVILLYALLALTFILAKKALAFSAPCFLIGFRMILAGIFLVGYCFVKDRKHVNIHPHDRWLFFKTALFHVYFAFVLEFWSLQYLTALKTNIIYSATPFIAALLGYFLVNDRLSLRKIAGIVIGLLGLMPVVLIASTGAELSMEIFRISLPEMVLFGAVTSCTYAWFLVKQLMDKGYHLGFINGVAMFTGGCLSLLTSFVVEGFTPQVLNWPLFLFWVLALIFVANLIVYNLYGWLLRSYSLTFITLAGFLCPSFGVLYEWLFMDGRVTWHYGVSIIVVALGLFVFYRDELKSMR
jgi:drug/metabolite transporter (DMT)-like permease